MSLAVVRPGPLALVQDAGRPGWAAVGVPRSGAFDRAAFRAGALLVGNDPARHAAVEVTLGGLQVRADGRHLVVLTGAPCPLAVDGRQHPWAEAFELGPGQLLTLGLPRSGLRSYLSVAGGIDVPPVLGSRSTDLLSGLGPARLAAGSLLPVGDPAGHHSPVPAAADPSGEETQPQAPVQLELLPGPRTDWLADPAGLVRVWTIDPASNRVGVRLTGDPVARTPALASSELPSEPLVRGAVQLPGSGLPVVFGPDHPTTGGYPVVAVLTEASSDRLAQCRPGEQVRLEWAAGW